MPDPLKRRWIQPPEPSEGPDSSSVTVETLLEQIQIRRESESDGCASVDAYGL